MEKYKNESTTNQTDEKLKAQNHILRFKAAKNFCLAAKMSRRVFMVSVAFLATAHALANRFY